MYVTLLDEEKVEARPEKLSKTGTCLPLARFKSGSHAFREGDCVEQIFQVESGVVSLARLLEDGRRQIIAFGFPGDIVGFPSDGRHHTDCEALGDVLLQPYRYAQVANGEGDPALQARFLEAALHEIAAMQDHFMMLGRKSAMEKVASFLIVLARRSGVHTQAGLQVPLPMSRADIADFLGLTTETVCRVLSQFRKSRVIALDGVLTVVLLRPEELKAMSSG